MLVCNAGSVCVRHGHSGAVVLQTCFVCKICGLILLSGHTSAQPDSNAISFSDAFKSGFALGLLASIVGNGVVFVKVLLAVSNSQQQLHGPSQDGIPTWIIYHLPNEV